VRGSRALKRLSNIAANPRVALVVDDYDADWTRLAYLLLHLDAAIVDDDAEYAASLQALRERYAPYRKMPLARVTHPMVRMTPRRWHLWRSGG
jgi:PPOX class probable F420-dependent enzyme